MSNDQAGGNAPDTTGTGNNAPIDDPALQEALSRPGPIDDPNLGGSTTADWAGDAGPDPGGIVEDHESQQ